MRAIGTFLIIFGIGIIALLIIQTIRAGYEYEEKIGSFWSLADKSSTIAEKSEYVDKFVEALEKEGLQGTYDAIIFKTNDNSFDNNFKALKSLQSRLQEIQSMDIKSFEYQTAIQQITQQEQGEANSMLSDISGAWCLQNHPFVWNWIWWVSVIFAILCIRLGSIFIEEF